MPEEEVAVGGVTYLKEVTARRLRTGHLMLRSPEK